MTELYTRDLTDSERFELESDLKLLNSDLGWAAIPGRLVKGTMAGLGCAFIPAAILCLFGAVVVGLSLGVAGTILGLSLSAVTAPSWWRGLQARREALREDLDKGFAEVIKVTAWDAIEITAVYTDDGSSHYGRRCFIFDLGQGELLWLDRTGFSCPESTFPSRRFDVAWTPRSRLGLNIVSRGERLDPSRTYDEIVFDDRIATLPNVFKFAGDLSLQDPNDSFFEWAIAEAADQWEQRLPTLRRREHK